MVLTPEAIQSRLRSLRVPADKFLGQHFLVNQEVLDQIVDLSKNLVNQGDLLVEVGPGLGVLTEELCQLGSVLAVEKDPVFTKALPDFLNQPDNLTVIRGDILALLDSSPEFPTDLVLNNYLELVSGKPVQEVNNWLFVANIPYGITSPLLRKLVNLKNPPRHIVVLVQKEVAERVCAEPGSSNRGLLTLQLELKAKSKIISAVSKNAFYPAPQVESAILHLDLENYDSYVSAELESVILRLAGAAFTGKRKQISNSLSAGMQKELPEVRDLLVKADIAADRRPETLTLQEWADLAEVWHG